MKLETFKEFIVVSETRSFTKAARRLYTTQPVLSSHIASLEKELGVALFDRTQNGLVLTGYGTIFLEEAKRMIAGYNRLVKRIENAKNGALCTLIVGYLQNDFGHIVPSMVRHFVRENPKVKVQLTSNNFDKLNSLFEKDAVDVALTMDLGQIEPDWDRIELESEPMLLAVSADSSFIGDDGERALSFDALADVPMILPDPNINGGYSEWLGRVFRLNGFMPLVEGYYHDGTSRIAQLSLCDCATIVTPRIASLHRNDIKTIPIIGKECRTNLVLVWKRDNVNPAVSAFAEVAREVYEELKPSFGFCGNAAS